MLELSFIGGGGGGTGGQRRQCGDSRQWMRSESVKPVGIRASTSTFDCRSAAFDGAGGVEHGAKGTMVLMVSILLMSVEDVADGLPSGQKEFELGCSNDDCVNSASSRPFKTCDG